MQRRDVSGAWVHDLGRPGGVRQGAWSDGSVGHPGAELQTSGAELVQRGAQKPANQQLFDKRNGGHHGYDRDVETPVTGQAAGIVMQLDSFEDDDDGRSDTNVRDQQVTRSCQMKSLAKLSTPVSAWGCDSNDGGDKNDVCDSNGATSGQLRLSAAKSSCSEEESLANKPVEFRKRQSILRRASRLWRSQSQVDLRACNTESNVGDKDAPKKKSFGLFKKATLKLAAVKMFEEGSRGKKGTEAGMKKTAVSQSMSNINKRGSDDGSSIVIPEVPTKKTLGLFKKAALKVRAVKRFEDSVKDRANKEEDSSSGYGEDTGMPRKDGDPNVPAKKSFSLFKKVALKLTSSKRLEANGKKDEDESVFEGQEEEEDEEESVFEGQEEEEGDVDGIDVFPKMDSVVSFDGGNMSMVDSDSDDAEDEDRINDNSSVKTFVKEGVCDSLPVVIRNTTVMAWGSEGGIEVDSDGIVSLPSCDRFTANGGTVCSAGDTQTLQADVEEKEKSTPKRNNQARGRFKKALTFLKAMNGFRGGSKMNEDIGRAVIEEVAEEGDAMSPVACVETDVVSSELQDCDVVSPFLCVGQDDDALSSDVQSWDGDVSSEEEDTVQCVEPARQISNTNMYASILELSSDESSNASDDDDVSVSSSGLASNQSCDVIDRLGEEPAIMKEVVENTSIVLGKSPKTNNGKRKIKRAFLMAKIVGLFKTKSNSSTKTLAVQQPEDGACGSVADFDQPVAKSDCCNSDGESVRILSADCSDGEKTVTDTDKVMGCVAPERNEEIKDVDTVCETQSSPPPQINTLPCVSAIARPRMSSNDDVSALSGSDPPGPVKPNPFVPVSTSGSVHVNKPVATESKVSVPASPSGDVPVDMPAATESKVVKRWKWFSQKKKANKKPNDIDVPSTTVGEPDPPTADGSRDATADGHGLSQGGCHQVECGACDR